MITIWDSFGIEPKLNMEQVWNTVKTFMQQRPQYKYGTNHQDIWNIVKTKTPVQTLNSNRNSYGTISKSMEPSQSFSEQGPRYTYRKGIKTRTQNRYGTIFQRIWNKHQKFSKQGPQYKYSKGIKEVWNIQNISQTRNPVQEWSITRKKCCKVGIHAIKMIK